MTQKQSKRVLCVAAVISSLFVMNIVWAAATHDAHMAEPVTLSQLQGETVPAAMQALMAARKAIQAGHTEHALAELQKLEMALMVTQKTLDDEVRLVFANATCPVMGSAIQADKVTDDLIRVFQSKKVAFCCGECLGKWDALTSAEKQTKLMASMARPEAGHDHADHAH